MSPGSVEKQAFNSLDSHMLLALDVDYWSSYHIYVCLLLAQEAFVLGSVGKHASNLACALRTRPGLVVQLPHPAMPAVCARGIQEQACFHKSSSRSISTYKHSWPTHPVLLHALAWTDVSTSSVLWRKSQRQLFHSPYKRSRNILLGSSTACFPDYNYKQIPMVFKTASSQQM